MSTLNQGQDVRLIQGGVLVTKASSALPLNTTQSLFLVSGGQVMINALVGNVTVATGTTAQTCALGFINNAAVGGTSTTCLGTGSSVASLGINSQIVANPGGAVTISPTGGVFQAGTGAQITTMKSPFLVPAGTVTTTTNANNATGTVAWYLLYTPLDNGANVTSL